MVVEPNAPEVVVWSRAARKAWVRTVVEGLDHSGDIPAIGVTVSLREIYDGVAFPARLRLVRHEAAQQTENVPSTVGPLAEDT